MPLPKVSVCVRYSRLNGPKPCHCAAAEWSACTAAKIARACGAPGGWAAVLRARLAWAACAPAPRGALLHTLNTPAVAPAAGCETCMCPRLRGSCLEAVSDMYCKGGLQPLQPLHCGSAGGTRPLYRIPARRCCPFRKRMAQCRHRPCPSERKRGGVLLSVGSTPRVIMGAL
jgi:hypothetical protein